MTRRRSGSNVGEIRIGISGWHYPPWRGRFYPKNLPQKQELHYASRQFNAIEINGTFYGQQTPKSFAAWAEATPPDFVFAVKGPRFITHIRRLRDARLPLANFFASGLLGLGTKLGPIFWQLPPSFRFDTDRINDFLGLLPHDTDAAVRLARQHDGHLRSRAFLAIDRRRPLRHAMEIRHESFRDAAFIRLLRAHRVALVVADTVEWPRLMDLTADFVYCRLHGSEELYASGYGPRALTRWAGRIAAWRQGREAPAAERVMGPSARRKDGRDVFVFFDNDKKALAPVNARSLVKKVGNAD